MSRTRDQLWSMIQAERTGLAEDLAGISNAQWNLQSLCTNWTIQQTLAHLSAAASIGPFRWFTSVAGARFDFDLHNRRRLDEHLGSSPHETLQRFTQIIPSQVAPFGATEAWLGEVIVHAQDIRVPLGLERQPSIDARTAVARFYAAKDFAVPSKKNSTGLRLESTDGTFTTGTGPVVSGSTMDLVMAMAGREIFVDRLIGPGVETLRSRITSLPWA
ncbi:hypothetical protein CQ018_00455 [Arthrobacter sp. MYb227]|uniref:maleylpyruvate isomerase family mycothiol-dependent enzyme n=1 Tax=Arthrobacter sp. MYb227 TaxID=1848601 RepID=UPI000CFCAB86|nr:maleylpyruvate isomerase family mycothiol-dependent enzyme [Arthrobacter sp. MYb227]PQZ95810.1 hypothetical protein CQ018_00455 [Arthrobacter sp. MYb227]